MLKLLKLMKGNQEVSGKKQQKKKTSEKINERMNELR